MNLVNQLFIPIPYVCMLFSMVYGTYCDKYYTRLPYFFPYKIEGVVSWFPKGKVLTFIKKNRRRTKK